MNQSRENDPPCRNPAGEQESAAMRRTPNVVAFGAIADGREEVWIELDEQIYRLRRTRQGKLILTK